ncbi:MAG TPA: GNAT family N-acetyltransferase [Terriglobales bacterium]|jgi:RimJ/RimL family protein N-acetyltransferase
MQESRIVLETPRLQLREFVPEDVDALAQVLSDAITMQYYPAPYDRQGVADWIERNRRRYDDNGYGLWAMTLKSSGELIGDCGLVVQNIEETGEEQNEIEIGYRVRRDHWNQGFATEAARACRDYGFSELKAQRLISLVRPENLPSRRVAEKNGMTIWKEIIWANLPHYIYAIQSPKL